MTAPTPQSCIFFISLPDKCRPALGCQLHAPRPQELDMDLVFLVDSSQGVSRDIYLGALRLVDSVLQDLDVAAQPGTSWHGARAALLTHTTPGFWPGVDQAPVLQHFHLTSHGHRTQMQRQLREAASGLLQGAPALGHALEWTLENVLLAAVLPRRSRVLFAIVASETSIWDREKLRALSQEAKCKGITLFVLALGPGVGAQELAELARVASAPSEQHLLRLEGVSEAEVAYASRFTEAFLNLLKSEWQRAWCDGCGSGCRQVGWVGTGLSQVVLPAETYRCFLKSLILFFQCYFI